MGFPWIDATTTAVAVGSAIWAAVEARRARQSEREAERLRTLEERVSGHKYDIYKPIIEAWADTITPGRTAMEGTKLAQLSHDFTRWLSVYGSDEAVLAFRNMMTTGYKVSEIPGSVSMRMYAEFVLAARRDMGDDRTGLRAIDFLAITTKDAYDNRNWYEDMSLPVEQVFKKYGWTPPWERTADAMRDDRGLPPEPPAGPPLLADQEVPDASQELGVPGPARPVQRRPPPGKRPNRGR